MGVIKMKTILFVIITTLLFIPIVSAESNFYRVKKIFGGEDKRLEERRDRNCEANIALKREGKKMFE
jgi:hypothetical protein